MTVHVFTADQQPATDYINDNFDPPMRFQNNPRRALPCWNCRRRRWAQNLAVQVYYDSTRFFCREKCKWRR